MKLNGWWRLWIAFSLVCVILGAALFGGLVYQLQSQRNASHYVDWMKSNCEQQAAEDASIVAGDLIARDARIKACVDRLAYADREELYRIGRWWAVGTLIPPSAALVLGLLGAWVARGFSQQRQPLA